MLTFGSLFAGIGGFDLGLERAGMKCVWQVEIDPYCRRVLAKHWPDVPKWDDVRTFTGEGFERPDLICGGFPCQDISLAGGRAGLTGERSGLWSEFARIVRLLRPSYVVVENVPGILAPTEPGRQAPIGCVLGELASSGYDAEWQCIPASAFGSTQQRYRVFIVAYPHGQRPLFAYRDATKPGSYKPEDWLPIGAGSDDDADTNGIVSRQGRTGRTAALHEMRAPARTDNAITECVKFRQGSTEDGDEGDERQPSGEPNRRDSPFVGAGWWHSEPPLVRMVYGVPRRLVRPAISGLGNSVVPQVAEWIGRRIMQTVAV